MAQPGMNPQERQAMLDLQAELQRTTDQVMRISVAHDALQAAHDALRAAARDALADRKRQIRETEDKLKA